jgi:hypothetical protein
VSPDLLESIGDAVPPALAVGVIALVFAVLAVPAMVITALLVLRDALLPEEEPLKG